MKILVTGASGFVGSHLVPSLLSSDHDVVAAGRSEDKLRETFPKIDGRLTLVATPYDEDSLGHLFKDSQIGAVVHMAAKRPSINISHQLEDYVDPNVLLAERIFKTAANAGVRNVVSLSSQSVYSSVNSLPFSEREPAKPDNAYGLSKLMGEETADMYNRIHEMQIKSLRIAQLIGPGDRAGYMLSTFMEKAIKGEPLPIWGEGKGARDYLYIDDLNAAILAALEYKGAGLFNIGSGRPVTHLDLGKGINRVFNNEAGIRMEEDKQEDETVRYLDVSFAERELGWRPVFELIKGLEKIKELP